MVAIAAIVALSGFVPVRMRIERGVCGLLLLGVVVLTARAGTDHSWEVPPSTASSEPVV